LPRIDYDLIRWHGHAALITVLISALLGILVATKFTFPTFLGGHAWETWGRLRYNHTQGIFFGWLGNAFIAFLYFVVPRLTNRPVTSRKLPGEIRSNASRSPQMRIVILRLPWGSGSTESYYIRGDDAHLLRVTVGASLAAINYTTMRFGCRESLHRMRSRAVNLHLKLTCGENSGCHP
jgi:hypothetical protein